MKIAVRAVAVTFLAAGTACSHLPGYQGPAYDFRKNAVPAQPGRKVEGALPSADSENRFAYRIDLGRKGASLPSATPTNPAPRPALGSSATGTVLSGRGGPGRGSRTGNFPPGRSGPQVSAPW